MDSMDCKPAYKDLDWRAYLRTIQKGLHSATASRTAAILESVPCWWGIGQISAGLRHHSGPNSGLIGLTVVLNFQTEAMAHEPKSHGLRPVRYAPIPPFLLTRAAVPGLRNLQKTAQWACFLAAARLRLSTRLDSLWNRSSELLLGGKNRAYWFFRQVRWKGLSVELHGISHEMCFHVSYTWQPRFLFGFCLLIFRSHFTLLANCAKSLTSTDSSIGSARAKNKRSKYNRDIGGFIFLIFHNIWDVILPIDELMFFRGVGIPPSRRDIVMGLEMSSPVAMSIRIPRSVVKKDCEAMVHFVRWFTQLWFSRANCSIPNGYES